MRYDGEVGEPTLPNFFIVGTGKAGTTSLYRYLRQHPQIYMSPLKEPCYFASEIRLDNLSPPYLRHIRRMSKELAERIGDGRPVRPMGWLIKEWDDYVRLFQNVQAETVVGEASVAYLWSETAAANIAAGMPGAKILMILRDPADRAFSQYLHQLAIGLTSASFREHIEKCMQNADRKISVYHPLLEVGLYYQQVRRYLDRFPRNNMRIYWYEEAWRDPNVFLADLFQFLNVDSTFHADTSRKTLERRAPRFAGMNFLAKQFDFTHRLNEFIPSKLRPALRKALFRGGRDLKMDPKDREYLVDYYREDILKLSTLLNRDLSSWLRM